MQRNDRLKGRERDSGGMDRETGQGARNFQFIATGIGSVPFKDVRGTCTDILAHFPKMPFWPQFVRRSHLEDMSIQFSQGLPLLEVSDSRRALVLSEGSMEAELVTFYDRYLAEDLDYFAVSEEYAPGLYGLLEAIAQNPKNYGPYVKGQVVGPVTFAAGVRNTKGKSILFNPDLLEAMVKGIAIKALWQVVELGKSGRKPIIFLDEPYLSGFGSAYSPIQRHEVIHLIKEVMDFVRERSEALMGIHCCGNTDWSMIMEAGPDILSFDAFGYMDYFLLYPEHLIGYIRNGGAVAWGIVPTADLGGNENIQILSLKLEQGISRLYEWGLDPDTVSGRSLLTPACGMGSMSQASADKALGLLREISERFAEMGSMGP
jgi:hypothetical protein